ncbi:MAG: hypothetical protein KFB93_05820 [Simkaniaceae bacterium]|nr:MAG: hypothetical protein KFB93_05820 [Simkaniaceae bacterium]
MGSKNFNGFVVDSITILKENAKKAKKNSETGDDRYNKGVLMAYCSVISLLKYQARAFNIDEKDLGLSDINPEADLLGLYEREQDS